VLQIVLVVLVAAASFLPGYLFYQVFLRREEDDPELVYPLGFGSSLVLIALLQLVTFLSGGPAAAINTVGYLVLTAGLFLLARTLKRPLRLPPGPPLALFALYVAIGMLLLLLLPSYRAMYMADWRLYFPNVAFYLRLAPVHLFSEGIPTEYLVRRTPFYSLACSFFIAFTGMTYPAFQMVSLCFNALIFWAVRLIARQVYGPRAAAWTLLLLPLAPIITNRVGIPTPKPLVVFYILLTFVLYRSVRDQPGGDDAPGRFRLGLIVVASFMVHPMALFYLLWLVVDQLYGRLRHGRALNWRAAGAIVALALVLMVPWYGWALRTLGVKKVLTPTYGISETKLTIDRYIETRGTMLASSLLCSQPFFVKAVGYLRKDMDHEIGWPGFVRIFGNPLLRNYHETFLGGFTYLGAVFLLVALCRARWRSSPDLWQLLAWAGLGAGTCLAVHLLVDLKGLAFNIMGPLVALLFVVMGGSTFELPSAARLVGLLLIASESAFVRVLYHAVTLPVEKRLDFLYGELRQAWPGSGPFVVVGAVSVFTLYASWLWLQTRQPGPADQPRTGERQGRPRDSGQ
jgi:hypothetical protein